MPTSKKNKGFPVIFYQNLLHNQKKALPLQRKTKKDGAIAQLVEQRTENPCVPGSIPGGTTARESCESDSLFLPLYRYLYSSI